MSYKIEIRLMGAFQYPTYLEQFPLADEGEEEPDLTNLSDEQITELVLGRVRDYVTHELL